MTDESTWTVRGMTCGHCVASVAEELAELPGVEQVDVALDGGRVVVRSATHLDRSDVAAAVEEAGYELVP